VGSFRDYLLFGIVYFVQGALGLTSVAMPIFLKDALGLSVSQIATLSAISMIPWVIKPVYGLLSDYYPVRGLHRKPYLFVSSLLASFGWFLTAANGTYWSVLLAQILSALGIAMTDVVADGLAVEKSTPRTKGKIQTVMWGSRSFGAVITGFFGGWLLGFFSAQQIFAMTGVLPLLTFCMVFFVREERHKESEAGLWALLKKTAKVYYETKLLWWVSAFLFLWFASPSFSTPLFFYMRDELKLSEVLLGTLTSMVNVGAVVGSIMFAKWFDKVNQKKLFIWLILLNTANTFLFYYVLGAASAFVIFFINGVLSILAIIASMRLIVEVCPRGIEATTFSLVTGISNLGSGVVAVYVGGVLYDLIGYKSVILANAVVGILPLLLIRPIFKKVKS
jgi:MFS family permease